MSPLCFFASDLHGRTDRYRKLFDAIEAERPGAVFLGGDLLPPGFGWDPHGDGRLGSLPTLGAGDAALPGEDEDQGFLDGFLARNLSRLRAALGPDYPPVFAILGNDDPRAEEDAVVELEARGLLHYVHQRRVEWRAYSVYGYACVPPTPFRLKDWERYDVSRYVDPGGLSPEEGWRTVPADVRDVRYATMQSDLDELVADESLSRAIVLFHCPPYSSPLDRAALDGRTVDYAPLDVHVGSIAIRRFILARAPHITLHGHVHESARLTGEWRVQLGQTWALSAAHDGPELALVRFDPERPEGATRELI